MAGKKLSPQPLIDPTAEVTRGTLGAFTEVGARTKLLDVEMGDYSYVVNDSDIAYARIGRFTSIAAMTRINPGNHPMQRASQAHFSYRASAYFEGAADEAEFFAWRRSHDVSIGHDVWIGHGAIVLPGCGHCPQLDAPDQLLDAVLPFLRSAAEQKLLSGTCRSRAPRGAMTTSKRSAS